MTDFMIAESPVQNMCSAPGCQRIFANKQESSNHHLAIHKLYLCIFCEDPLTFHSLQGYDNHRKRKHTREIEIVTIVSDDEDDGPQQFHESLPIDPVLPVKVEEDSDCEEEANDTNIKSKSKDVQQDITNSMNFENSQSVTERVQNDQRKVAKVQPAQRQVDVEEEIEPEILCNDCGMVFPCKSDLVTHLLCHNREKAKEDCENSLKEKDKSFQSLLQCPVDGCNVEFSERADVLTHLHAEHDEFGKYACSQCKKEFQKGFELYMHVRCTHEEKEDLKTLPATTTKSTLPDAITDDKRRRIEQWIKETNKSMTNVPAPPQQSPTSPPRRRRRINTVTLPSERVGCREGGCEATFNNVQELKLHRLSVHPDSKIVHCNFGNCDVPFNRPYLKRHMKEAHGVET